MNDHAHQSALDCTTYVCPMHPEVRQDSPGDCPKCGMHLAPEGEVEAHSGHDHHTRQTQLVCSAERTNCQPRE